MKAKTGTTINHAVNELISAMSSLNTYPDCTDTLDSNKYITDQVYAAKHAYEHIAAAITTLEEVQHDRATFKVDPRTCNKNN
jgi:hypothetical protein